MMTTQREQPLDVFALRQDFPLLQKEHHQRPIVYLDSAATSQKPRSVIDALARYYSSENANIHRGIYALSEAATAAYEAARARIAQFINAEHEKELIFVRGTTEGVNLVAQSFARPLMKPGDTVLVTEMEHHANIVPWQMVTEQTGAHLEVAPIDDDGVLNREGLSKLLEKKPKLLAITHLSNVLGTLNPLKTIVQEAHQHDVPVLVDAAQSAPHLLVDVKELDCDFLVFSGHKLFGPTGIGVLYGKEKWLTAMPPYQGGGDMIQSVSFKKTTYRGLPERFEAGTPNIAGAIGLAKAIDYLNSIGLDKIRDYDAHLFNYALQVLPKVTGLRRIGTATEQHGSFSFLLGEIHPYDVAMLLDQKAIAVRAGHQCAEPLMNRLGVPGTVRASFSFYNTTEEIDTLADNLEHIFKRMS